MNTVVLNFLKRSIVFVLVFCALSYLGDFSEKQSAVLAVVALLLYREVIPAKKKPKFVPYRVFINPNIHAIVTDFELVKDAEESWAEIRAGIDKLPKEPWNIWRSGFTFSFITPELIYANGWNNFSSEEVDLTASLEPIALAFNEARPHLGHPFAPRLNLKAGGDFGCVLQITLPIWYWEKMKTKEIFKGIAKHDASFDHECATVDVALVRVPPEEFGVYAAFQDGYSEEAFAKAVKIRTEARQRHGWKGKAMTDMYGSETGEDHSNVAEHKYCTVSHVAI